MAHQGQRRSVTALVVVASLVLFIAVFAIWAKRQLLETDSWVETSSQLLEDEDIRDATADFLVDELYANVDVQAELSQALPPQAQPLAGTIAGAIRQLADRAAAEALSRPRAQEAFEQANRQAHEAFVNLIEGGNGNVSTENGDVTLDLKTLVSQLGGNLGVKASEKLPPQAAQVEIIQSDQLEEAQDVVDLMQKLAWVLPLLALLLYALAIYLAHGRRREALRSVGFGFIAVGIAVLVARNLAGNLVVSDIATTASAEDTARSVWEIATSMLQDGGQALIGYGIAIVLAAWLAGPGGVAKSARHELAPILHDRGPAYIALGVLLALLFWWSPTEAFHRLIPSLILITLLVAGTEVLRRQTLREYPNETLAAGSERWRDRLSRS